jgi:hypothetical protein
MGRIEHIIASFKKDKKKEDPENISDEKSEKMYREALIAQGRENEIESESPPPQPPAKHDFEEEQKSEQKRQHQPSRFEEDVSNATKRIVTGAKRTIAVTAPAVKKVVSGTVKTVAPIINQMGKGIDKTDKEEKSKPKSTLFKPPREEKSTHKIMKQPAEADDYFASGFSKKPQKEQKSTHKIMKQPKGAEDFFVGTRKKGNPAKYNDDHFVKGNPKKPMTQGADDYFVSDRKKTLPKQQEKKGKEKRGFGLGF